MNGIVVRIVDGGGIGGLDRNCIYRWRKDRPMNGRVDVWVNRDG